MYLFDTITYYLCSFFNLFPSHWEYGKSWCPAPADQSTTTAQPVTVFSTIPTTKETTIFIPITTTETTTFIPTTVITYPSTTMLTSTPANPEFPPNTFIWNPFQMDISPVLTVLNRGINAKWNEYQEWFQQENGKRSKLDSFLYIAMIGMLCLVALFLVNLCISMISSWWVCSNRRTPKRKGANQYRPLRTKEGDERCYLLAKDAESGSKNDVYIHNESESSSDEEEVVETFRGQAHSKMVHQV